MADSPAFCLHFFALPSEVGAGVGEHMHYRLLLFSGLWGFGRGSSCVVGDLQPWGNRDVFFFLSLERSPISWVLSKEMLHGDLEMWGGIVGCRFRALHSLFEKLYHISPTLDLMYIHIYIYICSCNTSVCVYGICMYVYIYMYIYICIYIYLMATASAADPRSKRVLLMAR